MRTFLTIASTTLIAAATIMLVWRPVLGFTLALIGFCVNLWRLNRAARPAKAARPPVRESEDLVPTPPPVLPSLPAPEPVRFSPVRRPMLAAPITDTPANDRALPAAAASPAFPVDLEARVVAAGWQTHARGGVLYCVLGRTKLALTTLAGADVARVEDLAAAARLKTRYHTDFVGVISSLKPDAAMVDQARDLGVQFVNAQRLEAYLAMAGSFKPGSAGARRASA